MSKTRGIDEILDQDDSDNNLNFLLYKILPTTI